MKYLSFLFQYIVNPKAVGAILPSTRFLGDKMIEGIDFKKAKYIVEYETKGKRAILTVSNRTENPSVRDVDKLFERFVTGDKARRNNGGTGLGLAIAKRIVELHDGIIHAEYTDGWMNLIIEYPILRQ